MIFLAELQSFNVASTLRTHYYLDDTRSLLPASAELYYRNELLPANGTEYKISRHIVADFQNFQSCQLAEKAGAT
jgi:hypothetical protein